MSTLNIISLPNEILIEIFLKLQSKEILNCCEVCEKFDDIISNSSEVLRKICVTLTIKKLKEKWINCRKYSNLKLNLKQKTLIQKSLPIFNEIGSQIKILDLNCGRNLRISHLSEILISCERLKDLMLEIHRTGFDEVHQLPELDLNRLEIKGESKVFDIFVNSKVYKLKINLMHGRRESRRTLSSDVTNSLNNFLKAQKSLKVLKLVNFYKIMSDEFWSFEPKFKLKQLILTYGASYANENFQNFLEFQGKSLNIIKAGPYDDLRSLNQISKIKTLNSLDLFFCDYSKGNQTLNVMNYITNLTLRTSKSKCRRYLCGKFPNLKSLTIDSNYSMLEYFQMFRRLTFGDGEVKFSRIPLGLNDLEFKSCTFEINRSKFDGGTILDAFYVRVVHYGMQKIEIISSFVHNNYYTIKGTLVKENPPMTPKVHQNLSLLSLNDENLRKIFSFLPYCDVLNLTEVCSKFDKLISESGNFLSSTRLIVSPENVQWQFRRKYKTASVGIDKRKLMEVKASFDDIEVIETQFGGVESIEPYLNDYETSDLSKNLLQIPNSNLNENESKAMANISKRLQNLVGIPSCGKSLDQRLICSQNAGDKNFDSSNLRWPVKVPLVKSPTFVPPGWNWPTNLMGLDYSNLRGPVKVPLEKSPTFVPPTNLVGPFSSGTSTCPSIFPLDLSTSQTIQNLELVPKSLTSASLPQSNSTDYQNFASNFDTLKVSLANFCQQLWKSESIDVLSQFLKHISVEISNVAYIKIILALFEKIESAEIIVNRSNEELNQNEIFPFEKYLKHEQNKVKFMSLKSFEIKALLSLTEMLKTFIEIFIIDGDINFYNIPFALINLNVEKAFFNIKSRKRREGESSKKSSTNTFNNFRSFRRYAKFKRNFTKPKSKVLCSTKILSSKPEKLKILLLIISDHETIEVEATLHKFIATKLPPTFDEIMKEEKILHKIFSTLPHSEILNLTRVCRKFNQIISKSTQLLSNSKFLVSSENKVSKFERKYSDLKVLEVKSIGDVLWAFKSIENFGDNLKKISIEICENLKENCIKIMLNRCPKVEIVEIHEKFSNSENIEAEDILFDELPKFYLKLLEIHGSLRLLKIFKECSICDVKFGPKVHKIKSFNELNEISSFEGLKGLKISLDIEDDSELEIMRYIESLEIQNFEDKIEKLNSKFPNVKSLKLSGSRKQTLNKIFTFNKSLESLTFADCDLSTEIEIFAKTAMFVRCHFFEPSVDDAFCLYEINSHLKAFEFGEYLMKKNSFLKEISLERVFVPSNRLVSEENCEPVCKKIKL